MLRVHVQSEAVCRNIQLFKQIVKAYREAADRKYVAMVNRLTGAMRFADTEVLNQHEWKQIVLRFDLDKRAVEIVESDNNAQSNVELDPQADRVMRETLKIFQVIVGQIQNLKDFAHVELETPSPQTGERDLVHEAWHQLDRIQAEELLHKRPRGSYLFRKDQYATLLEDQLNKAEKEVKCITLTFLDENNSIRDKTVVKHVKGWIVYDDDPNLEGEVFETMSALLASMDTALKHPVLAD